MPRNARIDVGGGNGVRHHSQTPRHYLRWNSLKAIMRLRMLLQEEPSHIRGLQQTSNQQAITPRT